MTDTLAPVISEEYRRQQQVLHQNPNYGVASIWFAPHVAEVLSRNGAKTLSDYGAAGSARRDQGRTTQRKPTWEVELSRLCAWRAAGR